jgi:hypothetical protein
MRRIVSMVVGINMYKKDDCESSLINSEAKTLSACAHGSST